MSFQAYIDAIEKKTGRTPQNGHYFYEDFEHIDQGWGPFVPAYWHEVHTHLSEYHAGYTTDTIGGTMSFGYPISEPFIDPHTGLSVQYFERARFEYHPEHAGTE